MLFTAFYLAQRKRVMRLCSSATLRTYCNVCCPILLPQVQSTTLRTMSRTCPARLNVMDHHIIMAHCLAAHENNVFGQISRRYTFIFILKGANCADIVFIFLRDSLGTKNSSNHFFCRVKLQNTNYLCRGNFRTPKFQIKSVTINGL